MGRCIVEIAIQEDTHVGVDAIVFRLTACISTGATGLSYEWRSVLDQPCKILDSLPHDEGVCARMRHLLVQPHGVYCHFATPRLLVLAYENVLMCKALPA
jgi:hypothetical protein